MEIVSIEQRTFEAMVARFDRFVSRMEAICQRHGEKTMSEWMDNQDVCRMLNISLRTLQTLRDNGTLAYSQINHKTYYRSEDVKRIVSIVEDRRKEARFKGRTIFCFSSKWCHQESNRGHKDFQSFALPTELWHRLTSVLRVQR